jgi:hypothetical protein
MATCGAHSHRGRSFIRRLPQASHTQDPITTLLTRRPQLTHAQSRNFRVPNPIIPIVAELRPDSCPITCPRCLAPAVLQPSSQITPHRESSLALVGAGPEHLPDSHRRCRASRRLATLKCETCTSLCAVRTRFARCRARHCGMQPSGHPVTYVTVRTATLTGAPSIRVAPASRRARGVAEETANGKP